MVVFGTAEFVCGGLLAEGIEVGLQSVGHITAMCVILITTWF